MLLVRSLRCVFARCAAGVGMAASGLLLSACATLFPTDQTITISPSEEVGNGAWVLVESSSGTQRVQLPATIGVRSGTDRVIVRLQDDRYHPAEVRVGRSIRGIYWVNVLTLWGFLIDYWTGAMWSYDRFVVVATQVRSIPRRAPPPGVEPSSPSPKLIPARVSTRAGAFSIGQSGSGSSRR